MPRSVQGAGVDGPSPAPLAKLKRRRHDAKTDEIFPIVVGDISGGFLATHVGRIHLKGEPMQFGPKARIGVALCVALAVFTLLALYVIFTALTPSKAEAHRETTTASGMVIQHGSPLQTNEARSLIPGGDLLTCSDTNKNGRYGMCRMKDRESGDIRMCRDTGESDAVGCIQPGVAGRHYDWHQNGYRTCWTCANHWSNRKSIH